MNAMPGVVIEADYSAAFREPLLVVVAECKERESSLVPRVIVFDADHA
jgi:hypothetical protein